MHAGNIELNPFSASMEPLPPVSQMPMVPPPLLSTFLLIISHASMICTASKDELSVSINEHRFWSQTSGLASKVKVMARLRIFIISQCLLVITSVLISSSEDSHPSRLSHPADIAYFQLCQL